MKSIFVYLLLLIVGTVNAQEKAVFYHQVLGESNEFIKKLDYEAPLAMDFDTKNRPYLLNNSKVGHNIVDGVYQITTIRNNEWIHYSYKDELKKIFGNKLYINENDEDYQGFNASRSSQMMIDDSNNLFAVIGVYIKNDEKKQIRNVLVTANDIASEKFNGEFKIELIFPENATMASMEVRNGFNGSKKYAPLFLYTTNKPGFPYKTPHTWAQKSYCYTYVVNTYYKGKELVVNEPVLLDDRTPGLQKHSGGESVAVTKGHISFIPYLRHDSDPKEDSDGNNMTYIKVFNRKTNKMETERIFLFDNSPEFADGHSQPVIGIDKNGYLFVQGGSHSKTGFKDQHSIKPLDVSSWTETKMIGTGRTYTCIMIDENNVKHTFFRADSPYKLFYQNGDCLAGYEDNNGILFTDQNSHNHYRVFYHHLHKDRKKRIYVSWTPNSGADYKTWDFRRVLAFSDDSGKTWNIVTKQDFVDQIKE